MPSTVMLMVVLALLGGCAAREAPAPPTDGRRAPVATTATPSADEACRTDADCGKGQVCVSCGKESSCVAGCSTSADCPPGEVCAPVQCIRCPCPPLCRKQ